MPGFGSGVVVPGTGVSLQNRGAGFSLDPAHQNFVGPNKRPFHTIIPGFVMKGNEPLMSFGVMGGPMQAQGHVQMVLRTQLFGQDPQMAADAPRWRVTEGLGVACETTLPASNHRKSPRHGARDQPGDAGQCLRLWWRAAYPPPAGTRICGRIRPSKGRSSDGVLIAAAQVIFQKPWSGLACQHGLDQHLHAQCLFRRCEPVGFAIEAQQQIVELRFQADCARVSRALSSSTKGPPSESAST
jgi:hypothetical protein